MNAHAIARTIGSIVLGVAAVWGGGVIMSAAWEWGYELGRCMNSNAAARRILECEPARPPERTPAMTYAAGQTSWVGTSGVMMNMVAITSSGGVVYVQTKD